MLTVSFTLLYKRVSLYSENRHDRDEIVTYFTSFIECHLSRKIYKPQLSVDERLNTLINPDKSCIKGIMKTACLKVKKHTQLGKPVDTVFL